VNCTSEMTQKESRVSCSYIYQYSDLCIVIYFVR